MLLAERMPVADGDGSNHFADDGTLKHNCMERLMTEDIGYDELLGEEYKGHVVDQIMLDDVIIPTWEAYEEFADENNIELELAEYEVSIDDEIGGTADIIATNHDTVFIGDFKFGFNLVSPEENAQGLFYAMCGLDTEGLKDVFKNRHKICIFIAQPQYAEQGDQIIQRWDTTIERLNDFAEQYLDAVDSQDAEVQVSGDHCKYCPALPICPRKTGAARQALMLDPNSEDADVLVKALQMSDEVLQWAKAVQKFAHDQAELGVKLDGYKLVNKRATRKWTDEDAVLEMVRKAKKVKLEEATDIKLKSAPQLEKLFKKKDLDFSKYDAYIEAVSSGTTLVPEDDKRPEAVCTSALLAGIERNS
jgi:hypothetical protein